MDALHCLCLVSVFPESYLPNNWMNEWEIALYCQVSNFSVISLREQITFRGDDFDDVCFVGFCCVSLLKQQSVCRHFYHTLSYFASPSVFVPLNAGKPESTGLSSKTRSTVLVSSTETITPPIGSPKTGKWLCVLFFNHDRTPLLLI